MTTSSVRIDPGSTIGPYVVERQLAQGGMSVLFLAKDPLGGREVVLKMVPDEIATAASRARLLREARALASLDHPGIVRIFGTGEHEGTPWIAMEYVHGVDLKHYLAERGPVSPDRALRWVHQATDALAAAHDAGVIHRDLKPSNLLLTLEDRITIVDFGIAKRRAEAAGDVLTSAREVLGTPAYLSPEQLEHGLADERSDVWALGCVLYELCVGAPPFGRGGSATTVAAILRDEPAFPSHVPAAVVDVVMACLRKNSFARIASPRELAALLRDAMGSPQTPIPSEAPAPSMSARPSTGMRLSDRPLPSASRGPEPAARPGTRGSSSATPVRSTIPPPRLSSGHMRSSRPSTAPSARVLTGRVKGSAIRAGLVWFVSMYGKESLEKAYAAATPELRGILRIDDPVFGIIPSGWYDTQAVGELMEIMERMADPEDAEAYVNALTTAIAKDNVGGIYKSLFRLIATPSTLESNAQRVWQTYSDEGTMAAKVPAKGQLLFELRGWQHHHPTVCRVVGFLIQNMLRAVGYTALIVERTRCVADGDACCAFEGMYLP